MELASECPEFQSDLSIMLSKIFHITFPCLSISIEMTMQTGDLTIPYSKDSPLLKIPFLLLEVLRKVC